MQFVTNGPNIPDELLQAHEDERVVFFCGAGISYPAGLPDFQGLVDQIYRHLNTTCLEIEKKAYSRGQFDTTLDLLERRMPGQRIVVRNALKEALQPKLDNEGATDTHTALLQLARSRGGGLRLVTTNFDRIFEHVAEQSKQQHCVYAAPLLPVPKNSHWNGLVYLHGLLPATPDDSTLHRLVLSSGDFGLAYLVDRWAARFVNRLFRNYIVCFVGYSINDPVMRYLMDALAADRMLGEVTPQAYAFGDCEQGQEHKKTIEWKSKGVIPILYEVPVSSHDHSALHRTLKAWAEIYRGGKELIVVQYALERPSASTQEDDFVGRMLWALSDVSGLPAKRFATHDPAPSLEWLTAFSAAPWMMRLGSVSDSDWDEVMHWIAHWLIRHLNDPQLMYWFSERGGQLHRHWVGALEARIDEFSRLERDGKTSELDKIRADAPNAIPSPMMRTLWRLLLAGRVKSPRPDPLRDTALYHWKNHLQRDGLSTTLRLELRKLLAPMIVLKEQFRWPEEDPPPESPERLGQSVDCVATADVRSALRDPTDQHWQLPLPMLLDDFQQLLRDALDLLRETGKAEERNDRSYWYLPSISPHWRNRKGRDWVALVELLRDAWLALRSDDPERATRIAQGWFELPYSTFKRLAFFAASQDDCIDPEQWVGWLVADDVWWLWSEEMQREVCRLLVLQGQRLTSSRERLETAILAGPPREMYQEIVDQSVWLRLAKLNESGITLGDVARERLERLSAAHPTRRLLPHQREEFPSWMSGTGDPDFEANKDINIAPRKRRELVQWLKQHQEQHQAKPHPFYEDNWRDICRTRFFHCIFALCDIAQEGNWPADCWHKALYTWSEEGRVQQSWRYAASLVQTMPNDVLQEIAHSVAWWLEAVSKSVERHEDILLNLCRRVLDLDLPLEPGSGMMQINDAINHPIGHVTMVLLNLCFKRGLNDNDGLPAGIRPLFTQICDTQVDRFRYGRILLDSRLIVLFRVDRSWTEQCLLPLFEWDRNPAEAKAAWAGFLSSPRLYPPLQIAFKSQFLEIARHYDELDEHSRPQFAAFLTLAALESIEGYTTEEFQSAIGALPQEGLEKAAQTLWQVLEAAGEQRENYWSNRILPFWKNIWPKSRDHASNRIAISLARVSIAAGGEFPSALDTIYHWLEPIDPYVVILLDKSGLCGRFPEDALRLLNAIIRDPQWVPPEELKHCLEVIEKTVPELAQDARCQRIRAYLQRQA